MTVTPVLTATSPNTDRTYLVPPHIGSNVFPNNAIFSKLLRHARRNRVAIRDVRLGVERTYGHLLADVLALRTRLEAALDPRTLRSLERGDEVYIGVLAAGGYEFTVAVLTVLAVGAAVVPMCTYETLSHKDA
jgi:malonyl-CoA/methylmalonyl-CoA synthetase